MIIPNWLLDCQRCEATRSNTAKKMEFEHVNAKAAERLLKLNSILANRLGRAAGSLESILKKIFYHEKSGSVTMIDADAPVKLFDLKELREYRDLFFFLVWRDIKVMYAQSILGLSWAILQPLIQIVLFTIIFGKVARIPTGGIPYFLFSTVAIIPWTYMAQSMTHSSQSLVTGSAMLGKIYFPRLLFPITPILSRFIDFLISILILVVVALFYRISPTGNLVYFPFFVIIMMITAAGVGMWTSALAIRFRDVKHAMPFIIRMLMFTAPVIYTSASMNPFYRFIYSLNPIVAVIEGFRASLLGLPLPWLYILPGTITSIVLFLSGARYFKQMEGIFADVI